MKTAERYKTKEKEGTGRHKEKYWEKIKTMKDRLLAFISSIIKRPLVLQLEPTTLCNLKCEMCSHTSSSGMLHVNLNKEQLKNIKGKFLAINLSAIGEPLMNPQFTEVLKTARRKCRHLTSTSNLIMLDEQSARQWVELPVDSIYISIDGAENLIYEKIRKGAVFERLIENIKLLLRIKAEKGKKKPKLIVRFCPTLTNIHQMKDMPNLLSSLHLKYLDITIFLPQDEETRKLIIDEHIFEEEKKKTIENAKRHNVRVKFFKLNQKIKHCRARYTLIATASGEVLPCCFLLQKGDYNKMIAKYKIGDLYEDGLDKIWNCSQFRDLRKSLSRGKLPDVCTGCEVYNK